MDETLTEQGGLDTIEGEKDSAGFLATFIIMALYAALILPHRITQYVYACGSGKTGAEGLILEIVFWLVYLLIGAVLLLGWVICLVLEISRGGEKLFLLKPVFAAQRAISRADAWVRAKKYAAAIILLAQTALFLTALFLLRIKAPITVDVFLIPVFAGIPLRKGIRKYFTTAKSFLALTFFYCLLISVVLSVWIMNMYGSLNPLIVFAVVFGVFWLAASLIAETETASVVNITLGLGLTFLYTVVTYLMSVGKFDGMNRVISERLFSGADTFKTDAEFAAYLLLYIGIHAITTAAVTVKGYMIKRLGIREYDAQ